MFDECFAAVSDACTRRKRLIVGLAATLTAAAASGLGSISLENDLELMLPGDDQVRRSIRFLQESRFSDNVVVSLELKSPDRSSADLIQARIVLRCTTKRSAVFLMLHPRSRRCCRIASRCSGR